MSEENVKVFIGDKKVRGIREIEKKTPLGAPMIEVEFLDKSTQIMPKTKYEAVISYKAFDASTTNEKFTKKVAGNLYGMLHEYGVTLAEADHINAHLVGLINTGTTRASNILWGVEYEDQRTLLMVNDILNASYNASGTAGSGPDTENKE